MLNITKLIFHCYVQSPGKCSSFWQVFLTSPACFHFLFCTSLLGASYPSRPAPGLFSVRNSRLFCVFIIQGCMRLSGSTSEKCVTTCFSVELNLFNTVHTSYAKLSSSMARNIPRVTCIRHTLSAR